VQIHTRSKDQGMLRNDPAPEGKLVLNGHGLRVISNGLDRIDSSIGHVLENVVPCCFDCNIMKSNRTVDEFLAHIKKISSFQNTSKLTSPTP
jgi:hypothetical protein